MITVTKVVFNTNYISFSETHIRYVCGAYVTATLEELKELLIFGASKADDIYQMPWDSEASGYLANQLSEVLDTALDVRELHVQTRGEVGANDTYDTLAKRAVFKRAGYTLSFTMEKSL